MTIRGPDDMDGLESDDSLCLKKTPQDEARILRDASMLLPLEVVEEITRKALIQIGLRPVSSQVNITITKIGVVPDTPPKFQDVPPDKRITEIPKDIPKGALFASGTMKVPVPVCEKDETGKEEISWKSWTLGYSFYRTSRMEEVKIILAIFPYDRSSEFLQPESVRVSERQTGFDNMRAIAYKNKISGETFNGMKEKFEDIYKGWLQKYIQEMLDSGELSKIIESVENEKALFRQSDLRIDPAATEASMNRKLSECLRKPSPVLIPSSQSYVGEEAQTGWLNLCRAPGYGLASRELDLLKQNADKIIAEVGPVENVMVFGLGDSIKESEIVKKLLESRDKDSKPLNLHGIDVGMKFHLNALQAMKNIRGETGKNVAYRGHVALFESSPAIASSIHRTADSNDRTLRVSLGNTFCNFDDPWSVFARGMKSGDMLMFTSESIPSAENLTPEEKAQREEKIAEIVKRYQIPEWKEFVLNPLYRMGFRGRVHANNVEVRWDEASNAVVFQYKFTSHVDNGNVEDSKKVHFSPGEEIRLYMSKKIDPSRFSSEAMRNGLRIKQILKSDSGDTGCFILEKQ